MKRKVLLLLFGGCFALGAYAQEQIQDNTPRFPEDPNIAIPKHSKSQLVQKGGPVSAWFDMADYLTFALPTTGLLQSYASFIFPDSNVIFIPASDTGFYWSITSVGSVFDPADLNQQIYTSDYFTRKDSYNWDSLSLTYIYRRGTIDTNIVDTLYIDLFAPSAITARGQFSNGDVYGRPTHNATTKRANGSFKTITVLLTPEAETPKGTGGWNFGLMTEAVGQAFPAISGNGANMVGFTLNFRPGYTWNLNDTMEVSNGSSVTPENTLSYFGYRQLVNEGGGEDLTSPIKLEAQVRNGIYYTHSIIQYKQQFYGDDFNTWDHYIAGNAFYERQYIDCAYFFSGNSSVDVKDLDQFGSALGQAYPNPARTSNELNIEYAVKSFTHVSIDIYDIFGNKVKSVVNEGVEPGDYTATVDISDLSSGVYVYTMTDGKNYAASQKVSIIR